MDKLSSLTIFFPCYNEEGNIERVARAALEAAPRFAERFEIILVNDGSTDNTREIAERLAEEVPEIRAVHNDPNQGYGGAVQRGLSEAKMEWIFFTDGDGQFDIREMDKLIELLDRCDFAVGYRLRRADPVLRRVNAWCWGVLVRTLFGLKVRDIDCAFKLLPKSLIDKVELRSTGALISTELLAKAKYRRLRIAEVGVNHYPRVAGKQTGANLRVILRAFRELIRLRRHIRSEGLPNQEE
ncbi:MAG: glycosyltransferase family 2 protein [Phycisphaerae bacterium]